MGHTIHPKAANAIDHAAKRAAFEHWFGIWPTVADVLIMLLNARGEYITPAVIAGENGVNINAVITRIYRLRQAMNTEAIDQELGRGYRLTEVGIGEASLALVMMRGSLGA